MSKVATLLNRKLFAQIQNFVVCESLGISQVAHRHRNDIGPMQGTRRKKDCIRGKVIWLVDCAEKNCLLSNRLKKIVNLSKKIQELHILCVCFPSIRWCKPDSDTLRFDPIKN
jgi:hypothetical protein